jgi:hypothetical protein
MTAEVAPLLVLQVRAEAQARLYAASEYAELQDAIQPLMQYAFDSGIVDDIGTDGAFAIIRQAFAGVAEI